jgi:hypothetical protein
MNRLRKDKKSVVLMPNTETINAHRSRWNRDLLAASGIARVRQVAEDVRAMCEALNG